MTVIAIDQGTTGTTTVLYSDCGAIQKKAYREFTQIYPQPGWVEHDPLEIWRTVEETVNEVIENCPGKINAVGITNQRETTVVWNRKTGMPIHNAIVWQCRRTASACEKLKSYEDLFKDRTGLPLDAYFSGTKIRWLLDNGINSPKDELIFGTIDTWLIWKLTGGTIHATDYTNASRTLLFDIHKKKWDEELCRLLKVPREILPQVRKSKDVFGEVKTLAALAGVPILGVAGDQQAALFGQCCFSRGEIKNTYGTGGFLIMNTGSQAVKSRNGLVTTLAADGNGEPCFALEGSIFIAGAVIQWLRDELKIIQSAFETEAEARAVKDNGGVYLVPAFAGLGAPHWNMEARGIVTGLTRGANRRHIIRAALESIAYQSWDVVQAMEADIGGTVSSLSVDGGAVVNDFLMQFQSDILNKPVIRPAIIESTSLGAAYLAGLNAGIWKNSGKLRELKIMEKQFNPCMKAVERKKLLADWKKAVKQAVFS